MKSLSCLLTLFALLTATCAIVPATFAEGEIAPESIPAPPDMEDMQETEEPAQPERMDSAKFAVFVPEQVDRQWYWCHYTAESQLIVQNAIEKELVRAGFELVDISSTAVFNKGSVTDLFSKDVAIQKAQALGANYVIIGQAIADEASRGSAYGVNVVRVNANITTKIVSVADGKILAVQDAEAQEGGQALQSVSRDALKSAGKKIAREIAADAEKIVAPNE